MNKAIALIVGLSVVGASQAAVTILDDFALPPGGQGVNLGGAGSGNSSALGLPVPGGLRLIELAVTSGGAGASANSTVLGQFQLIAAPGADAVANIGWGSVVYGGPQLNFPLSDPAISGVALLGANNTVDTTYTVAVWTSGGGVSSQAFTAPAGFVGDIKFFAKDFVGTANLADIDAIKVIVDPVLSGTISSVTIDAFAIPEPNAGLALAGLCGLGVLVRRFKK